jgi:ERCC4-type nuclease
MKIIIDEREHELYNILSSPTIKSSISEDLSLFCSNDNLVDDTNNNKPIISKEVLPLGDIIIKDNDDNIILLIERKTMNDLLSSIKDGRYDEQSYRLIHSSGIPTHNIIYVLEGMFSQIREKERKIIYSSLTSLNFFKGFSIFRTINIKETAEWILLLTDKIERELKKGKKPAFHNLQNTECITTTITSSTNITTPSSAEYCNVVKKVKKENVTPQNISEIILCQIPGISSVTAMAITKNFNSFPELIKELNINPSYLENLQIETNGKMRRINKNCIENIKKYLLPIQNNNNNNNNNLTE